MSVELQPEELGFRRPFDREVTELLKITNTNKTPVAFKVKTTAPKQYCVRPNSGIIAADSNVEVQVLLQAMKEDPPLDARCRDKFLVQSVAVDNEDEANIAAVWSNVEKTAKSTIQEKKIRVQFLLPTAAQANGVSAHEDEKSQAARPVSSEFGTPAPKSEIRSTPTPSEKARSVRSEPAESTGLMGAAAVVSNAIPTSQDELKKQLADAQAQISKLTTQLSDPEVRQRKIQEASEKVQTTVQQAQDSGVPLQIVAGLCLLSFLIAYIFF